MREDAMDEQIAAASPVKAPRKAKVYVVLVPEKDSKGEPTGHDVEIGKYPKATTAMEHAARIPDAKVRSAVEVPHEAWAADCELLPVDA